MDLAWITQLGSTAAAIAVVVLFLKHLASEREVRAKQMADRDDKITKCVDKNSDVIDANTVALGQNTEVLRRLNGQELP